MMVRVLPISVLKKKRDRRDQAVCSIGAKTHELIEKKVNIWVRNSAIQYFNKTSRIVCGSVRIEQKTLQIIEELKEELYKKNG